MAQRPSPDARNASSVSALEHGSSDPRLPLYHRVREALLRDIESLSPGDRLPTEQELMERFGVSRTTVREAVNELARTGVIRRRSGSGTFVAEPPIEQELTRLTGFAEDMKALRLNPTAKVITARLTTATGRCTEQLSLTEGTEVMLIERVRLADGQPLSFDVTYLPIDIGLPLAQDDLETYPIFDLLETKYGVALSVADYRIEAANATSRVARHLRIKTNDAILLIDRTTYSSSGRPVDYEQLHYRGDRARYRLRLNR